MARLGQAGRLRQVAPRRFLEVSGVIKVGKVASRQHVSQAHLIKSLRCQSRFLVKKFYEPKGEGRDRGGPSPPWQICYRGILQLNVVSPILKSATPLVAAHRSTVTPLSVPRYSALQPSTAFTFL